MWFGGGGGSLAVCGWEVELEEGSVWKQDRGGRRRCVDGRRKGVAFSDISCRRHKCMVSEFNLYPHFYQMDQNFWSNKSRPNILGSGAWFWVPTHWLRNSIVEHVLHDVNIIHKVI